MSSPDRFPILHILEVLQRELLIVLLLLAQMFFKTAIRQETPYPSLHHCDFVPILPVKLSVVDVTVVFGEQSFSGQR